MIVSLIQVERINSNLCRLHNLSGAIMNDKLKPIIRFSARNGSPPYRTKLNPSNCIASQLFRPFSLIRLFHRQSFLKYPCHWECEPSLETNQTIVSRRIYRTGKPSIHHIASRIPHRQVQNESALSNIIKGRPLIHHRYSHALCPSHRKMACPKYLQQLFL